MDERFIETNGVRLHAVVAGSGPLVVLLHGFPQTAYAWRKQIPALAARFRVVAPDLRGYGESDKPPRVADYRVAVLVADIAGLIRALGAERAHIVGHDWGGAVAWMLAQRYPEMIERLAVLNSPHPAAFSRALRSFSRQLLRSWYIFAFQLPMLPEWWLTRDAAAPLADLLRASGAGRTFSEDDLIECRHAFCRRGAASAALAYYRALFRDALTGHLGDATRAISAPTLVLWGTRDVALGVELTRGMRRYFSGPFELRYIRGASHFVMEERPDVVNRALAEFLSA